MRFGDPARFIDHVGDASGVLVLHGIGGAVVDADLPVRIAEQRKREVELLREPRVLLLAVEADAEDYGVFLLVFFREVPEPGTLDRSAGCVRFRVKPEDHFLPSQ
jgi:hypothetical protein